jgi:uncharacterized ion transporter superfamily protein YfcC
MIFGFIPWGEFGIEMPSFTGILTGATLGNWWFYDAALWFLIISIIIAVVVYATCILVSKTIVKDDILMLPKGEKIAEILEKYKLLG